eukprot:TRINITY_DN72269_c0_g1_i1.p2 TRINITY_DN72269_c0_g1~~TRINITY_DN72269_c0_g1_i1.p2  ORF type:complete len:122 (+),score=11.58 TRINITY_DN72269_c0_g1_i1:1-366(+)
MMHHEGAAPACAGAARAVLALVTQAQKGALFLGFLAPALLHGTEGVAGVVGVHVVMISDKSLRRSSKCSASGALMTTHNSRARHSRQIGKEDRAFYFAPMTGSRILFNSSLFFRQIPLVSL